MKKPVLTSEYQDSYDVILASNGEYYGTIKVTHKARFDERIKRTHKLLPRLKNKEYAIDFIFKFNGTYKSVK